MKKEVEETSEPVKPAEIQWEGNRVLRIEEPEVGLGLQFEFQNPTMDRLTEGERGKLENVIDIFATTIVCAIGTKDALEAADGSLEGTLDKIEERLLKAMGSLVRQARRGARKLEGCE